MSELVDAFEEAKSQLVKAMQESSKQLTELIGPRPIGGKKVTPQQRVENYKAIRNDPEEWDKLIKQHGPGDALKYALELEKLSTKHSQTEELP